LTTGRIAAAHGWYSLYFIMGRCFPPQSCHFTWGDPDYRLTHDSLGPSEFSAQTASVVTPLITFLVLTSWPKPLREFARFIWRMQTERRGGRQPSNQANRPVLRARLYTVIVHINHRHLLLFPSPKADTHITVPSRVEGW